MDPVKSIVTIQHHFRRNSNYPVKDNVFFQNILIYHSKI